MVIAIVYSCLLNSGITSLPGNCGGMILLFLFLIMPLMLGLPLLVFWYVNYRRTQLASKLVQQFLRATAGPDELLVRELSDMKNSATTPIAPDQVNTE